MHRCNGETIEYICKSDGNDPEAGVWTESAGDDTHCEGATCVDENTMALIDVICNSPDLELDKDMYNQEGLEITCVEGGAGQVTNPDAPTVPAQNNCLLRCDYYPVLQFYTKGGDGWFYKYMEEDEEQALDSTDADMIKDIIRCW